MAVGPKRSQPCEGEQPSASGFPGTASRGQGADGQPLRYIGGNRVQRGHLGVAEDALEFRMDFDDEVAQLHDHGVDVGIVVAPLGRIFRQHTFHGLIA